MTSGPDTSTAHPLERLVAEVCDSLTEHVDAPAWSLAPPQITAVLTDLVRAENMLAALRLQLLHEADRHQVGDPIGFASTAGWWAITARTTKRAAHREVALAHRLDDISHQEASAALGSGAISVDQAAVILDAVEALPAELVDPALRTDAEHHLVGLAEHHDPRELRVLGRRVLDVLAPEISEEHEQRILEDEERHAAATATFVMRPDGQGSMWGRFKIPVLAGEILAKHLAAIAAPKHQAATNQAATPHQAGAPAADKVGRPLRLGAAFVEYLETREIRGTPKAGGIAATVVVTMTAESLAGESERAGLLDTGETISASEARRLACEAGIIPAVLGGRSQVLDLGRKTRFHTESQRTALMLRHRGCAAEHCDWPPGMCHAHHGIPWSQGGHTNVKDGLLLCPRHHALAHDGRYQLKSAKSGKVAFSRRT